VIDRFVRIGYWRSDQAPSLPDPKRFVDPNWDVAERETVTDYVRRGLVARAYLGKSVCRLCGKPVGALELSDGVFIWPEGLAHYLDAHQVRLPSRFVEHVHLRIEKFEDADVDDQWWASQAEL
jgi:hypothetical protein